MSAHLLPDCHVIEDFYWSDSYYLEVGSTHASVVLSFQEIHRTLLIRSRLFFSLLSTALCGRGITFHSNKSNGIPLRIHAHNFPLTKQSKACKTDNARSLKIMRRVVALTDYWVLNMGKREGDLKRFLNFEWAQAILMRRLSERSLNALMTAERG